MNNKRRERLADLRSKIEQLADDLEGLQMEEQESFDAMPDGLQQSDKGQASEQAASRLDDAVCSLRDAVEAMEEAGE